MPRNVRNFWVETKIEGRSTILVGGPTSKDGGFSTSIKARHKGQVFEVLRIDGEAFDDGTLRLTIFGSSPDSQPFVHNIITER